MFETRRFKNVVIFIQYIYIYIIYIIYIYIYNIYITIGLVINNNNTPLHCI